MALDQAQVCAAARAGLDTATIAERLEVSERHVRRVLTSAGIDWRHIPPLEPEDERIAWVYAVAHSWRSLRQVAWMYCVSHETVRQAVVEEGDRLTRGRSVDDGLAFAS